jgi:histidinol-phosphate aminotransferase
VPYKPGKPIEEVERELGITGLIKLASNENPLGPSPKAQEAIRHFAAKMHIYPDADAHELREALAAHLDIDPRCLVFGNGSDDIIHLLGVTFLEPCDEVIQADPTFVRYEAAAILNDVDCIKVPLTADWTHDLDAMAARITPRTRLVFITNPNNPTGTIVSHAALERFLDSMPERALTVIDEAYYEYAAAAPEYPSGLDWVRAGRNVVVLRTFSKAYGLAGLRLGYGVMRPETAHWLERTREPFNVNQMAQAAGKAALTDVDFVAHTVAVNAQGKRDLYAAFVELGLSYTPTYGNFVWVDVGKPGRAAYEALLRRGVIVRYNDAFGGPTHLRVSIGTREENARFLNALREVLPTL